MCECVSVCMCVCVCVCACAYAYAYVVIYSMHIIISFIMYCTLCVPIVSRATYVFSSDAPGTITEDPPTTFNFIATLALTNGFTLDTTIVLDIVLVSGNSSGT